MDSYELLSRTFNWSLSEVRSLSIRELTNWVERANRYL